MWFGTEQSGLSRYDGDTWLDPVPTGSAGGLAGNNVLSLLEDREHRLWVGTELGVSGLRR